MGGIDDGLVYDLVSNAQDAITANKPQTTPRQLIEELASAYQDLGDILKRLADGKVVSSSGWLSYGDFPCSIPVALRPLTIFFKRPDLEPFLEYDHNYPSSHANGRIRIVPTYRKIIKDWLKD